jgi:hypothetical protein
MVGRLAKLPEVPPYQSVLQRRSARPKGTWPDSHYRTEIIAGSFNRRPASEIFGDDIPPQGCAASHVDTDARC